MRAEQEQQDLRQMLVKFFVLHKKQSADYFAGLYEVTIALGIQLAQDLRRSGGLFARIDLDKKKSIYQ